MSWTYIHDPQSELDYAFDWSGWLQPDERIATHTVTVGAGLTLVQSQVTTDGKAIVWVSGGTTGTAPTITCHITTSQGRADDRTIRLLIRNR